MNNYIKSLVISLALPLIIGVANKEIPEEKMTAECQNLGKELSAKLRQLVGTSGGESVETLLQRVLRIVYENVNIGVDLDDKVA